MRVPKRSQLGIRPPSLGRALPGLSLAPASVTSLLGVALTAAFWTLALATLATALIFILMVFLPLGPMGLTVTSGGTSVPVPRAYVLFALGAVTGYLGGFALILRYLRATVHTLRINDPFLPTNVGRLKQIAWTLAVVTGGAWIGQSLVSRLVRGELDPPDIFDLVTPAFSVLVMLVLAQVFREGARERRESELTI